LFITVPLKEDGAEYALDNHEQPVMLLTFRRFFLAPVSAGEWVTAGGEWVNDRTHGQQFKTRFLRTSAPTTTEGI
jgi:hypothetical protein